MPCIAQQLLKVFLHPAQATVLRANEWSTLVRIAHREGILGKVAARIKRSGGFDDLPSKTKDLLHAATVIPRDQERMLHWEAHHIRKALRGTDIKPILLKGGAYALAGLPPAEGRLVSDIDILVPEEQLDLVERRLLQCGWEYAKVAPYDQHYYRTWMHELPPLRHASRQTYVDVHHRILPRTSRLKPDPRLLIDNSRPLPGSDFRILAPEDMVLHSCVHLFHDGDLDHGLRDLLDLHDLLVHFARHEGFWDRLTLRAKELGVERPLYYVLKNCKEILRTPMPDAILERIGDKPNPAIGMLMDKLSKAVLIPDHPDTPRRFTGVARWLLYVRSHFLRMPAGLLLAHLTRKTWMGLRKRSP